MLRNNLVLSFKYNFNTAFFISHLKLFLNVMNEF